MSNSPFALSNHKFVMLCMCLILLVSAHGTRTRDPLIKSQMLYQLSYALSAAVRMNRTTHRMERKRRARQLAIRPLAG